MLTKEDLQEKRTPNNLCEFVEMTFATIKSDKATKENARLKKGLYKEFIEEVYPFSIFCKLKYNGQEVLCCPVIGNQGYDAIIESSPGTQLEIVELTWPIDGQKQHFQSVQLNKRGYSNPDVWDYNDDSKRIELIKRIIKTAEGKALKDYATEEGASLIFVLNIAPYFGMTEVENNEYIELLKTKLKAIKFNVNSVYLLLLPIEELIEI
jgi:hypothetical protein